MSNIRSNSNVIPARLKAAREHAGLSQGQVAKLLEIRRPSISEMETGKRKVSGQELARLAEIYDVRISFLVGEDSEADSVEQIRYELAARELANLKSEDLDRVMQLLATLRSQKESNE
ncbi:MAG: helix-turn-helix transcriptional regulator [Chloroflexota bacterium]